MLLEIMAKNYGWRGGYVLTDLVSVSQREIVPFVTGKELE
jgi:hypothetical protein